MQGRLKQSSVVPFKGEQDQIGIRIENSQIYCSALGKIEMKLIVEQRYWQILQLRMDPGVTYAEKWKAIMDMISEW